MLELKLTKYHVRTLNPFQTLKGKLPYLRYKGPGLHDDSSAPVILHVMIHGIDFFFLEPVYMGVGDPS